MRYRQQQAAENARRQQAYRRPLATSPGAGTAGHPPETPARVQQELDLQLALGPAGWPPKGPAAPEVDQTYARARALCAQVGETPPALPDAASFMALLSESGTIADCAGAGGAALAAGAGRAASTSSRRPTPRSGRPCSTWANTSPPHTPRAGLHPHRLHGAAGPGAPPWGGARGAVPGRGGLDPVVPRLSGRRPCGGGRKRWPRPRRAPIPIVWRWPSTG